MNQKRYLLRMLDRFEMKDCKPRTIPCEQNLGENGEMADLKNYRESCLCNGMHQARHTGKLDS